MGLQSDPIDLTNTRLKLAYIFAIFHAFLHLFTQPKTPSYRSRYLLRGFKGFLAHITILEHEIRYFLVISLVFTVKIDAAVFLNLRIYDRFA